MPPQCQGCPPSLRSVPINIIVLSYKDFKLCGGLENKPNKQLPSDLSQCLFTSFLCFIILQLKVLSSLDLLLFFYLGLIP